MSDQRAAILELHRQNGIVRLFGVAQTTVAKAIIRYKVLGHEGDRPGRGRKRTVNTFRMRKIIKKRVDRNPKTSMRKIARDIAVSPSSVHRIAKDELGLKPYRTQKVQLIMDKSKRRDPIPDLELMSPQHYPLGQHALLLDILA
ncbi:unnamed protein product [Heligmosomoides polygyrus]|uniref:HTH_Tnp_Tc3_2 domain-containing protein n=1 Tax=Heligmosomoides polygyrus TaxID=6339 RepID=A0A183FLD9_HELPZ|nr:unnamed protein product [Heligmosomoides polygyrus]